MARGAIVVRDAQPEDAQSLLDIWTDFTSEAASKPVCELREVESSVLRLETEPSEHFFTLREEDVDRFKPVAAFDIVANNADRKAGHCMQGLDGTVWFVDHGVCFAADPKLRTVIWDFAGDPVPRALLADLRRVARELRSGSLHDDLSSLLSPREVEAAARRADRLVRAGTYPWPITISALPLGSL